MKKISLTLLSVLFIGLSAFTAGDIPKDFHHLLDRANMSFEMPDGFKETKCIKNDQVMYNFAMKLKGKDFEVRYIIFPLDSMMAQYDRSKKDTSETMIQPNNMFRSFFLMTVLNASMGANGGMGDAQDFDDNAVKEEFNATNGKVIKFSPGKEFGQDYTEGIMVGLHRDNVGDAYIFFLSHSKDDFADNMKKAFHCLRFN